MDRMAEYQTLPSPVDCHLLSTDQSFWVNGADISMPVADLAVSNQYYSHVALKAAARLFPIAQATPWSRRMAGCNSAYVQRLHLISSLLFWCGAVPRCGCCKQHAYSLTWIPVLTDTRTDNRIVYCQ